MILAIVKPRPHPSKHGEGLPFFIQYCFGVPTVRSGVGDELTDGSALSCVSHVAANAERSLTLGSLLTQLVSSVLMIQLDHSVFGERESLRSGLVRFDFSHFVGPDKSSFIAKAKQDFSDDVSQFLFTERKFPFVSVTKILIFLISFF